MHTKSIKFRNDYIFNAYYFIIVFPLSTVKKLPTYAKLPQVNQSELDERREAAVFAGYIKPYGFRKLSISYVY